MTFSIFTFLIVCPFVFLAGLVDAIAGGGGIIDAAEIHGGLGLGLGDQ